MPQEYTKVPQVLFHRYSNQDSSNIRITSLLTSDNILHTIHLRKRYFPLHGSPGLSVHEKR